MTVVPPGVSQRPRVLGLIALATLPVLLLAALSAWRGTREAEALVTRDRVALARAAALTTSSFVEGNLSTVRTLTRTRAMTDPDGYPDLEGFVRQMLRENPDWEGVGIVGADGWNIASSSSPPRSASIADRPYFKEVMATGEVVVSPALIGRRTGIATIVLAGPIEFADGSRGALVVSLSTARLSEDFSALHEEGSIDIFVVDSQGQAFVHPSPREPGVMETLGGHPAVGAALAGQVGSQQVRGIGSQQGELLVAYAPVRGNGGAVLTAEPVSVAFGPARRQLLEALSLLGLAAALTGLIGWFLGGWLSRAYRDERDARARAETTAAMLRKLSEESESRRRFLEGLINSAPVPIAVFRGRQHRHVTVNPSYQAIEPNVEMVGRTLAEVFPELVEDGMLEMLDRVYRSGSQFTEVDRLLRIGPDARERYFTIVIARYEDSLGQPEGVLLIAAETTEAVMTRQRTERAKDEFLSIASHELKTPLTSLALSAQMIERMLRRNTIEPVRLERYVASIRQQISRASDLIGDLLDVSRLDLGASPLRIEAIDLPALVEAAAQRQRDTLPEGRIHEIEVEVDRRVGSSVEGDEVRLDQVLTNLLSNAVKYSPNGAPIRLQISRENGSVRLRVVDRGLGVPSAERDSLFEPFSRTTAARKSGIEGTGLGLYISRRIVEAHGGTIRVDDTPGGGATFTVSLPVTRPNGSPVDAPATSGARST